MKVVLALLVAVAGSWIYHLGQKSLPRTIDPSIALILAYATALTVSIIPTLAAPSGAVFRKLNDGLQWPVIAVGIGAALIELGFLLAYRFEGKISVTALMVNASVAILLMPTGVALFSERLSKWNLMGALLCLVGLTLIALPGNGRHSIEKKEIGPHRVETDLENLNSEKADDHFGSSA